MAQDIGKIFGERLRDLREKRGLTQAQLAKELNISRAALGYYEGGRAPNIDTLDLAATYFNVPLDYLMGRTSASQKENIPICNDLGITEKSVENLRAIKASQLNANLLLEKNDFKDIVKHLCEIERLEMAKRYYDTVINPIANGDEFYDNLILNDVKLCKFICDNLIKTYPEHKQECEKCNERNKFDKDYIFDLIRKALDETLSEFGATFVYCPDWLSEDYEDMSALEEFKLTKSAAAVIAKIKDSTDCSAYFLEKNKAVRSCLTNELKELEAAEKRYEVHYNNGGFKNWNEDDYAEHMGTLKAKITAIKTFLEKYGENFKLKKGTDKDG